MGDFATTVEVVHRDTCAKYVFQIHVYFLAFLNVYVKILHFCEFQ